MKQIQKLIEDLLHKESIAEHKARKMANTHYYLEQQRKGYVAPTPEGFKQRSSATYFMR